MPEVHFVGEICDAELENTFVSLTWAIVPRNAAWLLRHGNSFGETQSSATTPTGNIVLNHPVDMHFETYSCEGWPIFVCDVWEKADGIRNFLGCGSIWLPSSPGVFVPQSI